MQYIKGVVCKKTKSEYSSAWLERYVRDVEVAGSNPVTPTIFLYPAFTQ